MAIDSLKQPDQTKVNTTIQLSEDDNNNFDNTIRPQSFDEYVGQSKMKEHLHIMVNSAKTRQTAMEHLLFYGPPGL